MAGRVRTRRRAFGSVRELKSGRFQARYYSPDGQRHLAPQTYETRADANAFLTTVEADLIRQTWRAPKRSTESVSDYVSRWIDQHAGIKDSTRSLYRKTWRLYIDGTAVGRMRLADLSPDTVRTWHFELAERKKDELGRRRAEAVAAGRTVSAATRRTGASVARHAFLLLRAAMSTAAADELIRANPCRSIRGAGVAQGAERPTLSAAEVLHLAEVIFPRYRALVLLAAFSALRFGELAALRRANLDLRTGRAAVRVVERVYRIDGALDFDTPKSRAGMRTVTIPDALAVELQRHLEAYTSPEPDAFVFTSSNGHVLTAASLSSTWQKARAAIGRPDVRFHDLRHTGQTLAALAGATQAELMQRLGHSTGGAALNYMHATQDHSRAVAQALGRYLDTSAERKSSGQSQPQRRLTHGAR